MSRRSRKARKLTPTVLRRIVLQEKRRMMRETSDPVAAGIEDPEKVDAELVAQKLPRGTASVRVVKGGLNVVDADNNSCTVVATAAVEAWLDIDPNDWVLSGSSAASRA